MSLTKRNDLLPLIDIKESKSAYQSIGYFYSPDRQKKHDLAQDLLSKLYNVGATLINEGIAYNNKHISNNGAALMLTDKAPHAFTEKQLQLTELVKPHLADQVSEYLLSEYKAHYNNDENDTNKMLSLLLICRVALDHLPIAVIVDVRNNLKKATTNMTRGSGGIEFPNGSKVNNDHALQRILDLYICANLGEFLKDSILKKDFEEIVDLDDGIPSMLKIMSEYVKNESATYGKNNTLSCASRIKDAFVYFLPATRNLPINFSKMYEEFLTFLTVLKAENPKRILTEAEKLAPTSNNVNNIEHSKSSTVPLTVALFTPPNEIKYVISKEEVSSLYLHLKKSQNDGALIKLTDRPSNPKDSKCYKALELIGIKANNFDYTQDGFKMTLSESDIDKISEIDNRMRSSLKK